MILIGSDALTLRYTLALQHLNIASQSWGAQATWAGLFALASSGLASSGLPSAFLTPRQRIPHDPL